MSPVAGREGLLNQSMDIISPGRQVYQFCEPRGTEGPLYQDLIVLLFKFLKNLSVIRCYACFFQYGGEPVLIQQMLIGFIEAY